MIDCDSVTFTVRQLKDWKQRAENAARIELRAGSSYRALAETEICRELSEGEVAVLKELQDEFGCQIELSPRIPAGGGWVRFWGAVVRNEDLIGIDTFEYQGGGFPFFQVQHLIEICSTFRFDRFHKATLYVAVVSNAAPDLDRPIEAKLTELAEKADCEVLIRMYRLNQLRAKHAL